MMKGIMAGAGVVITGLLIVVLTSIFGLEKIPSVIEWEPGDTPAAPEAALPEDGADLGAQGGIGANINVNVNIDMGTGTQTMPPDTHEPETAAPASTTPPAAAPEEARMRETPPAATQTPEPTSAPADDAPRATASAEESAPAQGADSGEANGSSLLTDKNAVKSDIHDDWGLLTP